MYLMGAKLEVHCLSLCIIEVKCLGNCTSTLIYIAWSHFTSTQRQISNYLSSRASLML